ncbi:hypothetical protein [Listeria booriae]|uniref:hypothetical protein n=1 Tax=Listeria booriae TaxID=1552123 RepID=UPI00162A7396|nr:hypothetical protein [Listeria booriae]MBC2173939.1 hypothetical protein [Listeria booriae]
MTNYYLKGLSPVPKLIHVNQRVRSDKEYSTPLQKLLQTVESVRSEKVYNTNAHRHDSDATFNGYQVTQQGDIIFIRRYKAANTLLMISDAFTEEAPCVQLNFFNTPTTASMAEQHAFFETLQAVHQFINTPLEERRVDQE